MERSVCVLLEVENLATHFVGTHGLTQAVRGVSFTLSEGETLALVGESGCGKSVTALSLLRLVPPPGKIVSGVIRFEGTDLSRLSEKEMRQVRGNRIAMIFQEPTTSLNPVLTIGDQITEVLKLHLKRNAKEAQDEAEALLHQVGVPAASRRLRDYPHQLSGGMRQRVMIAMALACRPKLLIADEPTTALDVTIQAQILDLLKQLKEQRRMAILLISHDLGVVAQSADRVAIMREGIIVEQAPATELYRNPLHPYTQGLLNCIPQLGERHIPLRLMPETPLPEIFGERNGTVPPLVNTGEKHWVRRWEQTSPPVPD
ncbi:MAG: ABC transporter ATP-binding protein [bacterium]|nr:ABC transporter ATP-binding protein [bacterium]